MVIFYVTDTLVNDQFPHERECNRLVFLYLTHSRTQKQMGKYVKLLFYSLADRPLK